MIEFESNQDQLNYIEREANKAIANAIKENSTNGLPNVFVIDGKLIYKMPNGRIRNTSPFKEENNKSKKTKT